MGGGARSTGDKGWLVDKRKDDRLLEVYFSVTLCFECMPRKLLGINVGISNFNGTYTFNSEQFS